MTKREGDSDLLRGLRFSGGGAKRVVSPAWLLIARAIAQGGIFLISGETHPSATGLDIRPMFNKR